ncbi:hypothetical protein BYT27DRAFT_7192260 [Phlegmacium glaucopus]|nr:hypothetical protein BYT27DRAFT_7192260 [Phlegmacium glaucopus]
MAGRRILHLVVYLCHPLSHATFNKPSNVDSLSYDGFGPHKLQKTGLAVRPTASPILFGIDPNINTNSKAPLDSVAAWFILQCLLATPAFLKSSDPTVEKATGFLPVSWRPLVCPLVHEPSMVRDGVKFLLHFFTPIQPFLGCFETI